MANSDRRALENFRNFRRGVDVEIRRRARMHQARIAKVHRLVPSKRPLNLLADGDSWFDYPLKDNGLGRSDIIAQLPDLIDPSPTILPLAHWGDAMTQLLGVGKRQRLVAALNDPKHGRFDAILFSGGGNDLVGDQFRLWLEDMTSPGEDVSDALNQGALDDIMGVVVAAYKDLIAARNTSTNNPDTPILVHAYDFALPTNRGVCGHLVGPWLFPSLQSRGWMQSPTAGDLARGAAVVRRVLLEFDRQMTELENDKSNNVIYVKAQGTLTTVSDWANELHPTPDGFTSIARKFAEVLTTMPTKQRARAALVDSPRKAKGRR